MRKFGCVYNHKRRRQSLDDQTPAEVYFQTTAVRQKQTTVIKSTLSTKGEEPTLNKAHFCLDFGSHLIIQMARRLNWVVKCLLVPHANGGDALSPPLSGTRKIVDVIFSYSNCDTNFTEKFFVRVDVIKEFSFLVTELSRYYDR